MRISDWSSDVCSSDLPLLSAITQAKGAKAIYVGDSAVDVETARAAAMPSIAVGFGFSDVCASQLGADLHIDHFDMLPSAVRSIIAPARSNAQRASFDLGPGQAPVRSEERRVGKECVSMCRLRWLPYHYKK